LNAAYKAALFQNSPYFTAEEVIGSYLGHNPGWPSDEEWSEVEHGYGDGDDTNDSNLILVKM
jgi:hypothetical protein